MGFAFSNFCVGGAREIGWVHGHEKVVGVRLTLHGLCSTWSYACITRLLCVQVHKDSESVREDNPLLALSVFTENQKTRVE